MGMEGWGVEEPPFDVEISMGMNHGPNQPPQQKHWQSFFLLFLQIYFLLLKHWQFLFLKLKKIFLYHLVRLQGEALTVCAEGDRERTKWRRAVELLRPTGPDHNTIQRRKGEKMTPKVIQRSSGLPLSPQAQSAWARGQGCCHLSFKGKQRGRAVGKQLLPQWVLGVGLLLQWVQKAEHWAKENYSWAII